MKRGEIYYADLNSTVGPEINKRRPVLIVGNDANNRAAGTVTVLPITSNVSRVFPFEVLVKSRQSGLPRDSKVLAQQIRTVARARIMHAKAGQLDTALMRAVDAAIKLHFTLA